MNPPQVYMCSPSWTLFPPPSPFHPSGSSQCTSPKHPVSCIEAGLATHFIHDILHVSMPFSQIFPPSPSPTESIRLPSWITWFMMYLQPAGADRPLVFWYSISLSSIPSYQTLATRKKSVSTLLKTSYPERESNQTKYQNGPLMKQRYKGRQKILKENILIIK